MNSVVSAPDPTWTDHRFAQWKGGSYVPAAWRRAVEDLQHYYQQPIDAIAQRYWSARDQEDGQAPTAVAQDAIDAMYQTTDRYIYECSYFEAMTEYQGYFELVRRACTQFCWTPVLDFGGGAGGMTLALSLGGVFCDYADVPGPTSDYARWRFQRHAGAARVLDATHALFRERYGAIVTLDVFEHLPDLPSAVGRLVEGLAPGGWLITKSTFAPGDPMHLPQNMIYADIHQFNRLLAECGLTYRGRLRADPLSEWRVKQPGRPRVWWAWLDPKPKFGGRFVVHQRRH